MWWSYAGILEKKNGKSPSMTCPHCGFKTDIKVKEGFKHNG